MGCDTEEKLASKIEHWRAKAAEINHSDLDELLESQQERLDEMISERKEREAEEAAAAARPLLRRRRKLRLKLKRRRRRRRGES